MFTNPHIHLLLFLGISESEFQNVHVGQKKHGQVCTCLGAYTFSPRLLLTLLCMHIYLQEGALRRQQQLEEDNATLTKALEEVNSQTQQVGD